MRDCARAPSGMFTPSTPASLSKRIESSVFFASTPFGGSTSTEVTNSPRAILRPQFDRSSGGTTLMSGAVISTDEVPPEVKAMLCARGDAARTESQIILMCDGVVPQQPPMNFAPAWINRFANFDMYSGEHM